VRCRRRSSRACRGGIVGNCPAHVLGAKNLAQHFVALARVRGLRAQHLIQQPAAAQLAKQPAKALQPRGLGLRLLFHAAQDGGQQRLGAGGRLVFAHAQIARDRLQAARLGRAGRAAVRTPSSRTTSPEAPRCALVTAFGFTIGDRRSHA
jgi:hypothetical protein